MQPRQLIEFMNVLGNMKRNTRHVWSQDGRRESVADHSWRLAVMALLVAGEFPGIDSEKLVKMCLIHDFGEAITGDIPSFLKTKKDEVKEEAAISDILENLPENLKIEYKYLFAEMAALETTEAKVFKALDRIEACISHNESLLKTWLPNEFTDNLTYGAENVTFSEYMTTLREDVRQDSIQKIERGEEL